MSVPLHLFIVGAVVVILLSLCTVAVEVDGASFLATTVSNGLNTVTAYTIPTGGTTLRVGAMLDDAASSNLSQAVFNATGLTFEGTLTIALPATASAWTAHNIPLRIVIQAGSSGATAPWPTTFIQVTGVLALGSSITIQDGSFHYTNQFINLPSGLTLQDGSTLAIEGGTFHAYYPTSGTHTSLVKCSGKGLLLSNRSILSISNYDMTVAGVSASGAWFWVTLYVRSVAITIDNGSTLTNSNAKVRVSDVTLRDFTFWIMSLYATDSIITISSSSALSVESNVASIANVNVFTLYMYELHATNTPIAVHTTSFISLSHCATVVTNVKTKGWWAWITYYPASSPNSDTTIHTNSSIIITNNSGVTDNVYVGDVWAWYTAYSNGSPLTVTSSSSFSITDISKKASNVKKTYNLWWYELHCVRYPLAVTNNSTITIANIHMTIADVSGTGEWYWAALYTAETPNSLASLRTFSNVSISNVHMVASNAVVASAIHMLLLYSKSTPTSITSFSTISISNNSVSLTNVNGGRGTHWHPIYNTDSTYTLNTGGIVSLSKNTLSTATMTGPLTSSEVWMSRTQTAIGISTATGVCNRTICSGTDSNGAYTCGTDGSTPSKSLLFDCTADTPSSHAPTELNNRADASHAPDELKTNAIVGIVVGVAAGLLVVIVVAICLFRNRNKNTPPSPPSPADEREMSHTINNQLHPQYNGQPVLGVPIETPVVGQSSKHPYGDGGCYL